MKTIRPVANRGDYLGRIQENVENGWNYPSAIVTTTRPYPMMGNVKNYYHYCPTTNRFKLLARLPGWSEISKRKRYDQDKENIRILVEKGLRIHSVQSFVKMRF